MTEQKSFHNTVDLEGDDLVRHTIKAIRQDDIVLEFFENNPGEYTPCEVHKKVLADAPLTSVRRAITNLTKAEKLEKTDIKRLGSYHVINCTWQLKENR